MQQWSAKTWWIKVILSRMICINKMISRRMIITFFYVLPLMLQDSCYDKCYLLVVFKRKNNLVAMVILLNSWNILLRKMKNVSKVVYLETIRWLLQISIKLFCIFPEKLVIYHGFYLFLVMVYKSFKIYLPCLGYLRSNGMHMDQSINSKQDL